MPDRQSDRQPDGQPANSAATAKLALRDQIVTARKRRTLLEVGEAVREIADRLVETTEVRRAATLTAYVSIGTEPGTTFLLDRLAALGKRVLLPVVLAGLDLDWAVYDGPASLAPARRGLLEPVGPRLGVDAIGTADVVLTPGQAVSSAGDRMGQGGGCYDRALTRVPLGTPVWVLVYDDEVGLDVPVEPHDRKVTGAVSPSGVHRF